MFAFCLLALLLCLQLNSVGAACPSCDSTTASSSRYTEVTYRSTTASLINPDRGALVLTVRSNKYSDALTYDKLDNIRKTYYADMVWRQWYLEDFVSSDISTSFLDVIQTDLKAIRSAGFKAVIRFAYTEVQAKKAPYGDATKFWILRHIDQLAPIIQRNVDVISAWQAGFIGIWGEWYYTTHFGDPNIGSPTAADWANRAEVMTKLLSVLPNSRLIQLRTPKLMRKMSGHSNSATLSEYRKRNTAKSRIGFHNDCFLATDTDSGTYTDKTADYLYLEEDSKYTMVGGETCKVNSPRSDCPTALSELKKFHWDYINLLYEEKVLLKWKKGGCYDSIMTDIGYKLSLNSAILPTTVASGNSACLVIKFQNNGYSAPVNDRDVKILLRSGGKYYTTTPIAEFQSITPWLRENKEMTVKFSLKFDVPAGDYEMLIEFSDPMLVNQPDYSILLYNKDVPILNKGLNLLKHSVKIVSGSGSSTCPGFSVRSKVTSSGHLRCYRGCTDVLTEGSGCIKHLVNNPKLESKRAWSRFGSGFTISNNPFSGSHSFQVDCVNGGFNQQITLPKGTRTATASLWSKSISVTGAASRDYSIYADLSLAGGSNVWGLNAPFNPSTSKWHQAVLLIEQTKDISSINLHGLCRRKTGTALFDEFYAHIGDHTCKSVTGDSSKLCFQAKDRLFDGGFEVGGFWSSFMSGFDYSTSVFRSGAKGIKITNGGAYQDLQFPVGTYTFVLSAWSKADRVPSSTSAQDYGIYCDVKDVNGASIWGQKVGFSTGKHDWEKKQLTVTVAAGIKSARCYMMYRNVGRGEANFDDVALWLVNPQDTSHFVCPLRFEVGKNTPATIKKLRTTQPTTSPNKPAGSYPRITSTCRKNEIKNGGLETDRNFYSHRDGYSLTSSRKFNGKKSFKVDCDNGGFYQTVKFSSSANVRKVTSSLWSYPLSISGLSSSQDYSLYVDIELHGGGSIYGKNHPFSPKVRDWQQGIIHIATPSNIKQVDVYGLCRRASSGDAYFDEMALFVGDGTCN